MRCGKAKLRKRRRVEKSHAGIGRRSNAPVTSDRRASRRAAIWFARRTENAGGDGASYIDNLDARLEMFAASYTAAKPLARVFSIARAPVAGNLVKSLEKFQQAPSPHSPGDKLL